MTDQTFLPGVPAETVLAALRRSPGHELNTGKFDNLESSAALAANAFGWFLERPSALPPLPSVPMGPPEAIAVEEELRLPWTGGRHPWADVVITTPTTLVGLKSTRYEPFRPRKSPVFTEPFASREWGPGMARWNTMRRALDDGSQTYRCLDAVQLVKTAYALRNQSIKRARGAVLVYLHASPPQWANGKPVSPEAIARHAAEITDFARAIKGDDVAFAAVAWADLLAQWAKAPALAAHAVALKSRFGPL